MLKGLKLLPKSLFINFPSSMSSQNVKRVENTMRKKLEVLEPTFLDIMNESYMHNVPSGSETHFKVVVISNKFKDVALLKRHRLVNEILKEELQNEIHALSIVAKTPDQWEESKGVKPSPKCLGGFGR